MTMTDEASRTESRDLHLSLALNAPRDKVWRCWTEADLLKRWFAPAPWTTPTAELDVRPGGRQRVVMRSPDGQEAASDAVYLEVVPGRRLVTTTGFSDAWVPSHGTPFSMTVILSFEDASEGRTAYTATVRHWSRDDRDRHEAMGFHAGWTTAARQLEAVAQSLPDDVLKPERSKLRTCLWFDGTGEEAAEFYVSLLPDSFIETVYRPVPDQPALVVEFTLAGVPYMTLNGGPQFKHTPASSISVLTADQTETDRLWAALIADGGEESRCGWLVDRFGVSWQIVPETMVRLLNDTDTAAAGRVQQAMMQMGKIDIASLEAASRGD